MDPNNNFGGYNSAPGGMTGGANNVPFGSSNSSSGPIVINGGGTGKKSRWKVIIVVVAVVVAVLVVVGLVVLFPLSNGNEKIKDINLAKRSFNVLMNYIIDGEEDDSNEVDRDEIENGSYYAFTIGEQTDKKQYIEKLANYFSVFADTYYDNGGDVSLDSIMIYYNYYLSLMPLTYDEILSYYLENGYENTKRIINDYYSFNGGGVEMNEIIIEEDRMAKTILDFIRLVDDNRCLDSDSVYECLDSKQVDYNMLSNDYTDAYFELMILRNNLRTKSTGSFLDVWDELYGEKNE